MSFTEERLYAMLPAIYRIRDAGLGDGERRGPLKALLGVIAEEIGVLEDNLAQLYEDQFIETCSEWAVPYLGDLLGVRGLEAARPGAFSRRAFVANTIGYRRRKGTALMLEQMARDLTGWDAHVVEYFRLLSTTQSMHHLRPDNLATPDLRQWEPLSMLNTPFDSVTRTVDVRRIASGRGRYNIPNIGIFLWRLKAYSLTLSPAPAFEGDQLRYTFSPLGHNIQLFTRPETEGEFAGLSGPLDVPMPIGRRMLDAYLDEGYYGQDRSLFLQVEGVEWLLENGETATTQLSICDLSDKKDASDNVIGWAHMPIDRSQGGKVAIDPVLGRIAFPSDSVPTSVKVSFHSGFSMDMGGGEYARSHTFDTALNSAVHVLVPNHHVSIHDALLTLGSDNGSIEISDSGRYEETPNMTVAAGQRIELRAAEGTRPLLKLGEEWTIVGNEAEEVILNGWLIAGESLRIKGRLKRLVLQHCTLVPGLEIDNAGRPVKPDAPSLIVDTDPFYPIEVVIDHSIVGPLRMQAEGGILTIRDSLVAAPLPPNSIGSAAAPVAGVALAADKDGNAPGPASTFERVTVMGRVHVREMTLASNSLFVDPVLCERRQTGCFRFSYVPEGSRTPQRYHCQPDQAVRRAIDKAATANSALDQAERDQVAEEVIGRMVPAFTHTAYGHPAFAQLSGRTPHEIRTGADDGSEMGAFHDVYGPRREANLRSQLDEYVKFGMEAGLFYVT